MTIEASARAVDTVLWDLDGTLSDSAPGILAALRHAFAVNGVPPMDADTERRILGPPFYDSLPPLIGDVPLAHVIGAYREHYRTSMFDTVPYDGVRELLSAAADAGLRMAVATSKPEAYAVPIVEHLGFDGFFATVGGDELDGSLGTKSLVIGRVLSRLGDVDPARTLMVGDREHDVFGARDHGIPCAGAGWGYGGPGELAGSGAAPICARPHELFDALGLAGGRGAAAS